MLKIEVLISTMYQNDHSLLERMNIQTDAIVVNQCETFGYEVFQFRGHTIKWFDFPERGVGLSRNTALMRATGDILLFADDDVIYDDGYEKIVIDAYTKHPKAGMIVFNVPSVNPKYINKFVQKDIRLCILNCLKYGTCRFSARREVVFRKNVFFSLLFGGGAKYQAGEDSLFILQMIRKGVVTVASSRKIGVVTQVTSTWFKGYTNRYYLDKGAWLSHAFPVLKKLLIYYFAAKMDKIDNDHTYSEIFKLIKNGFV